MSKLSRNLSTLERAEFDVLVIGGGINGAGIAWDAALRGYRTALIEKEDFGGETSTGCFKIAHGGARYLQHLELPRLRDSVREQQTLRHIAPHLIHPLPFLIPCYGYGMRGKPVLRAGFTLYDLLTAGRNAGLKDWHQLPNHRVISAEECLRLAPGLVPKGLTGGLIYYDCQMSNCERLTFLVAKAAAEAGASVFNYLECVGFETEESENGSSRIRATIVKDRKGAFRGRIQAQYVINASGPWVPRVLGLVRPEDQALQNEMDERCLYSKGIQVVLPSFLSQCGLAIESKYSDPTAVASRGGRNYFAFPWRKHTLLGTSDSLYKGDPNGYGISREEIRTFVNEVREVYKAPEISIDKVKLAWGGLRRIDSRTMKQLRAGEEVLGGEAKVSHDADVVVHRKDETLPVGNLISVVGVKYTTFRSLSEQVVNLMEKELSGKQSYCLTSKTKLPGGEIDDFGVFLNQQRAKCEALSHSTVDHLAMNYGTESDQIFDLIGERPEWGESLTPEVPGTSAEVVHVLRSEMIGSLSDVIMRRTGLGTLGLPNDAVLGSITSLASRELGWDKARCEDEIRGLKARYAVPLG